MRSVIFAFAAVLAACSSGPVAEVAPGADGLAAVETPVANLPDFKPETAAACNAVSLRVGLSAGGALTVNGAASDQAGLRAAAERKNAACLNAPAMVFFDAPGNAPAREATLTLLSQIIVNIGVIEIAN
jgi:hypothetical protein